MRRTLLAAASAVAVLAVGASPAAADDPKATSTINDYGTGKIATCKTPNKSGVAGAFGAWGHYIDGCTIRVQCPQHLSVCGARAESRIGTRIYRGDRVTLNSRTRVFLGTGSPDVAGSQVWRRDVSCDNTDWCRAEDDEINLRGGQFVSVQCNGVRESTRRNHANVSCSVNLAYKY